MLQGEWSFILLQALRTLRASDVFCFAKPLQTHSEFPEIWLIYFFNHLAEGSSFSLLGKWQSVLCTQNITRCAADSGNKGAWSLKPGCSRGSQHPKLLVNVTHVDRSRRMVASLKTLGDQEERNRRNKNKFNYLALTLDTRGSEAQLAEQHYCRAGTRVNGLGN